MFIDFRDRGRSGVERERERKGDREKHIGVRETLISCSPYVS